MLDLSDVTLIFCLPGAREPGSRPGEFTRYETTWICLSRRRGFPVGVERFTPSECLHQHASPPVYLGRIHTPRVCVCITRNKQEIKHHRMGRRESRARKSTALMANVILMQKRYRYFFFLSLTLHPDTEISVSG